MPQILEAMTGPAIGAGMGLLLEGHNDRRQLKQQGKLLEQQYGIDNRMAEANYERQMRLWNDTNYTAQVGQLKAAGLNPALLYKGAGAGGTTQAMGGAVSGAAKAPAGGMEVMNMMMQKAQMELIRAQTEKTKAETTNVPLTGQNIQASTSSLLQGIENAKAQQELTDVETKIKSIQEYILGKTQNLQVSYMQKIVAQAQETLDILENNKQISEETVNQKIDLVKLEVINQYLGALATQQQTEKTKQEIKKLQNDIQVANQTVDIQKGKLALETAIADGTIINWAGGAMDVIKRLVGSWMAKK